MVALVDDDSPSHRLIGGADVIALAERRVAELQQQIEEQRIQATTFNFEP